MPLVFKLPTLMGVTLTLVIAPSARRVIKPQNGLAILLESTQLSTRRCRGTTLIASSISILNQSTDTDSPGAKPGVNTAPTVQLSDSSSFKLPIARGDDLFRLVGERIRRTPARAVTPRSSPPGWDSGSDGWHRKDRE